MYVFETDFLHFLINTTVRPTDVFMFAYILHWYPIYVLQRDTQSYTHDDHMKVLHNMFLFFIFNLAMWAQTTMHLRNLRSNSFHDMHICMLYWLNNLVGRVTSQKVAFVSCYILRPNIRNISVNVIYITGIG